MNTNAQQIAAIVAQVMAMNGGKAPRKQRSDKGFTKQAVADALSTDERRAQFEANVVKAFTKAGYKDIQPRVNVLTYGKVKEDGTITGWLGQGRRVKKGEHAIFVKTGNRGKGMPLFHISQTEPTPANAEKAAEEVAKPPVENEEIPF